MKQDIGFLQIPDIDGTIFADLAIVDGDLGADEGLETAVLISLFTDRFVPKEELPDGIEDSRGWWADALSEIPEDKIGSRIWLLDRGKLDLKTKNRMKDFADEALAWMLSEGIASKVEVTTLLVQNTRIELNVKIYKPDGDNIPFRFLWDGQAMKRG